MLTTDSPNQLWTPRWTHLKAQPAQLHLWRDPVPFKVVAAGRRSGKTELAKRKVIVEFINSCKLGRADRYLVAAPTSAQAEGIYWEDLLALLDPEWVEEVSRSEVCIRGVSGASIVVTGLDSPQRIEGIAWRGAIIDEIADCPAGTWAKHIFPALAAEGTWAWIVGVPDGDRQGQADFRRLSSLHLTDPLRWGFYTWSSEEILSSEILVAYRKSMDSSSYDQEFNARFVAHSGAAFGEFDLAVHVKEVKYDPGLPICWALDFNVNPMCSGVFQFDLKERVFRILHEFCLPHTDTLSACEHFERFAKEKGWELSRLRIYGDATGWARDSTSGLSDWEIVEKVMDKYRARYELPRSNPHVKDSVNAVRAILRDADKRVRIVIDPGCKMLIRDLQDATWPGDLDRFHALAWLRYAASFEAEEPRVMPVGGVISFSQDLVPGTGGFRPIG